MNNNYEEILNENIDEYTKYLDEYLGKLIDEAENTESISTSSDELREKTLEMCKKINTSLSESFSNLPSYETFADKKDDA